MKNMQLCSFFIFFCKAQWAKEEILTDKALMVVRLVGQRQMVGN